MELELWWKYDGSMYLEWKYVGIRMELEWKWISRVEVKWKYSGSTVEVYI